MKSELTQIREGNRKVRHWKIVACVIGLVACYAVMGKLDAEERLAEVERIAALHPRVDGHGNPPVAMQRQASINHTCGGVL